MGLGLTACGGSTPTVTPASEAPAADTATADAPATESPAAEQASEAPTVEQTTEAPTIEPTIEAPFNRSAAFGDTVTFEGGVNVMVTFDGFRPASATAAGAVEGQYAVFTITAVNNSPAEVEAGLMSSPQVRAGAIGTQAQIAVDFEANVGTTYLSTMLPGST